MSSQGTTLQKRKCRMAGWRARPRVNMLKQKRNIDKRRAYRGLWWVRQDQRSVQTKGLNENKLMS